MTTTSLDRGAPVTAWAAAAVLLAVGCDGSQYAQEFCEVKGKVTFEGKPLPGGTVLITNPTDTELGSGPLNEDGEFHIAYAPAGPVVVAIQTDTVKSVMSPELAKSLQKKGIPYVQPVNPKEIGYKYVPIPSKYASRSSSDLRYELKPNQVNELTIELK